MSESWLVANWIEIAGAAISLIYLYFSIKQNILLWPFGILSALFYVVIYLQSKFYADMGLQVYYVAISIYGWWGWTQKRTPKASAKILKITRLGRRRGIWIALVFLLIWTLLYFILKNFTDSEVPFGDSFTTAGGIVATWMLARKILDHWLLWIVVDLVSLILYTAKDLWPTMLLFGIYTTMAVVGYFSWLKTYKGEMR